MSCWKIADEMNRNGTAWCREHRDELVERILANSRDFDWKAKLPAAMRMLMNSPAGTIKAGLDGLAVMLAGGSMVDATVRSAIGSLIDEAIRRAEAGEV